MDELIALFGANPDPSTEEVRQAVIPALHQIAKVLTDIERIAVALEKIADNTAPVTITAQGTHNG